VEDGAPGADKDRAALLAISDRARSGAPLYRRECGQADGFRPEAYERRLFILLLRARKDLAYWKYTHGEFANSLALYESILLADPEAEDLPEIVYPLAGACLSLGLNERAEPLLQRVLRMEVPPRMRAGALLYLAEIHRRAGRESEARSSFEQALNVAGLDDAFRQEIDRRAGLR
jgi:tetratricopeptide (TPR) repeat protein